MTKVNNSRHLLTVNLNINFDFNSVRILSQVSKTGFAAGTDYLTLADLTFICNFSSMVETNLYPEIFEDFPHLKVW